MGERHDARDEMPGWDTPAYKTSCGHAVKKGDQIGYARKHVQCAECWRKWVSENAYCDILEARY